MCLRYTVEFGVIFSHYHYRESFVVKSRAIAHGNCRKLRFSDGEDYDPALDEAIPQEVDLMDKQPDSPPDSPPNSSRHGSDEESTPPNAAENRDSENETRPHHPKLHRRGCKRPRVENDGEPVPVSALDSYRI